MKKNDIFIDEKYINGLKECYIKIQSKYDEINIIESAVIETQKELGDWIDRNKQKLLDLTNKKENDMNDVNVVEDAIIEYEKTIDKMKNKIAPHLKELENIKKDITNIYTNIMTTCGNKYTEDEIIEYIKNRINQN